MVQLLELPDELLISVMRHLRGSTSLNQAWQTLPTCKKLYEIGFPVLTEHIKLTENNIEPFLWSSKAAPRLLAGTKSMTVHIGYVWPSDNSQEGLGLDFELRTPIPLYELWPCSPYCVGDGVARERRKEGSTTTQKIMSLANLLQKLARSLESFSITIDPFPRNTTWCPCSTSWIGNHVIADVIQKLPHSCTSIYIDTGGADYKSDKDVIGRSLSSKSSTIKHLWVRVYSEDLCSFMSGMKNRCLDTPHNIELEAFRLWQLDDNPPEQLTLLLSPRIHDSDFDYDHDERLESFRYWKLRPDTEKETYVALATKQLNALNVTTASCLADTWPSLISLIINNCFFPIRHCQSQSDELAIAAQVITRDAIRFPKLAKCTFIEPVLDKPSALESQVLTYYRDRIWMDNSVWHPFSTIIVWDVTAYQTHALPILQITKEYFGCRENNTSQPLHLLHDQHGGIHHGTFDQLDNVICNSLGPSWVRTQADNMITPALLYCEFQNTARQTEPWTKVVAELAAADQGLDLYIGAWTAQSYTANDLVNQLELYWERDSLNLSRRIMPSVELRRLALCYHLANEKMSSGVLLVDPWIAGWLEDGKSIAECNWRYRIRPIQ